MPIMPSNRFLGVFYFRLQKKLQKVLYMSNLLANFATEIQHQHTTTTKTHKKMKTYAELKAFVEKTNAKYEINPLYSTFSFFSFVEGKEITRSTLVGYEFGINNVSGRKGIAEWAWTWFEFTCLNDDEELTEDSKFFFRNRYNAATGYEDKSLDGMIRAEQAMNNRMSR